eukprot:TRINITY_DN6426_c0_g1_i2.p3 TRINITY_DN6426_c0_g1~~TRINITY_DN6426_c0_g1_i2.p3  ORF type:complete len:225 (-),score=54.21 TRINITY_DN6426_c0_g1_i2:714-1388(-)
MIHRNTTIPTKKSQVYSTATDNQTQVGIKVFQGEREMAADNKLLGQFDLVGIPPAPRGVPQIEVTFDIDANGIVHVNAKDKQTGKEQAITIQSSGGLSEAQIDQMVQEADSQKEKDKQKKQFIDAQNEADNLVYSAEKSISEYKDRIPQEVVDEINKAIGEVRSAKDVENVDDLKSKCDELSRAMTKIGSSMKSADTGSSSSSGGDSTGGDSEGDKDKQQASGQ